MWNGGKRETAGGATLCYTLHTTLQAAWLAVHIVWGGTALGRGAKAVGFLKAVPTWGNERS